MKIEHRKNATRNVVFGENLKIYKIIISFVMRTTMFYCMGVQYFGLNSLFTSILQILNLAKLGVGSAMVYSMYKPLKRAMKRKFVFLCTFIKFVIIYLVL